MVIYKAKHSKRVYGWAQGLFFWLVLRCLWGVAWSIIRFGAYYMIFDSSTDENRGYLTGSYNGLSRLGTLVGMLAGGFFVEWFGIRDVATVFGILAFMVLPIVLIYIPNTKNRQTSMRAKLTVSTLVKQSKLLWILVTVFIEKVCFVHIVDTSIYFHFDRTNGPSTGVLVT